MRNNPFFDKLILIINKPSLDSTDVSFDGLTALINQARLICFPIYSLLVVINIDKKRNISNGNLKSEGWVSSNKEQNVNNTEDNNIHNQNDTKNNIKLYIIIAIIVIAAVILGITFMLPDSDDKTVISEDTAWNIAIKKNTERSIKLYINMFPKGNHIFDADSALYAIEKVNAETPNQVVQLPVTINLSRYVIKNLAEGKNVKINVEISPESEGYKVSCSNSNITYTLNDNYITITGIQSGNSILKVYANSNPTKFVNCNITVVPKLQPSSPITPDETSIKVTSIKFTSPISSFVKEKSYSYRFKIQPDNANTVSSLSLNVGNRELLQAPTSIHPDSREVSIRGKNIGNTQIWLKIEQNDGTVIVSKRHKIIIVPNVINITNIHITNKNDFSQEFIVGDYLPNVSVSYNPENTTQKGIDTESLDTDIIEFNTYGNKYKAKTSGVTYIKVYSTDDNRIYDRVKITVKEVVKSPSSDNNIYSIVDVDPTYNGGQKAYVKFLNKNIKYPRLAQELGTEGKVFISFIVEKNGRLTNIKVERGIGNGCDEEAKRVIEMMPNWNPGKLENRKVRVKHNLFVPFKLY